MRAFSTHIILRHRWGINPDQTHNVSLKPALLVGAGSNTIYDVANLASGEVEKLCSFKAGSWRLRYADNHTFPSMNQCCA